VSSTPDPDSDASPELLVGKVGRTAANGKWHVFRREGGRSLCGKDVWNRLSSKTEPRSFDPGSDDLGEVIGLGEVCSSCREYVTGSLSSQALPKPEKTGNGHGTGNSILEDYRQTVEMSK